MTILIYKGQENSVTLTLTELANLDNPLNWLLVFQKKEGGNEQALFVTDVSEHTGRYNRFTIDEPNDIDFEYSGDYIYRAYQMPDTDDTDYTRGLLVEVGRARVIPETENTSSFAVTGKTSVHQL